MVKRASGPPPNSSYTNGSPSSKKSWHAPTSAIRSVGGSRGAVTSATYLAHEAGTQHDKQHPRITAIYRATSHRLRSLCGRSLRQRMSLKAAAGWKESETARPMRDHVSQSWVAPPTRLSKNAHSLVSVADRFRTRFWAPDPLTAATSIYRGVGGGENPSFLAVLAHPPCSARESRPAWDPSSTSRCHQIAQQRIGQHACR